MEEESHLINSFNHNDTDGRHKGRHTTASFPYREHVRHNDSYGALNPDGGGDTTHYHDKESVSPLNVHDAERGGRYNVNIELRDLTKAYDDVEDNTIPIIETVLSPYYIFFKIVNHSFLHFLFQPSFIHIFNQSITSLFIILYLMISDRLEEL